MLTVLPSICFLHLFYHYTLYPLNSLETSPIIILLPNSFVHLFRKSLFFFFSFFDVYYFESLPMHFRLFPRDYLKSLYTLLTSFVLSTPFFDLFFLCIIFYTHFQFISFVSCMHVIFTHHFLSKSC